MTQRLRRGWRRPRWRNRALYPLSLGYAAAMAARRAAYRRGWLAVRRLSVPLVVVGNLSVGGTGKTPLVIALATHLAACGMRPGVITRGYRGRVRHAHLVAAQDSANEVGDEALLIARRAAVPVAVGRVRTDSAALLVERCGCDVIISDDGFQHLALAREVDIVVIDGERGLGNGWCLPAGPLREPPRALRRADFVVVRGEGEGVAPDVAPDVAPSVAPDVAPSVAPGVRFVMTTSIRYAVPLGGGDPRPLSEFAGRPAHAVAAIGHPQRFFRQLSACGISLVTHRFPDHHPFTAADLAFAAADPDMPVLMTEKDAVKCAPLVGGGAWWKVPLEVTVPAALLAAVRDRVAHPSTRGTLP